MKKNQASVPTTSNFGISTATQCSATSGPAAFGAMGIGAGIIGAGPYGIGCAIIGFGIYAGAGMGAPYCGGYGIGAEYG